MAGAGGGVIRQVHTHGRLHATPRRPRRHPDVDELAPDLAAVRVERDDRVGRETEDPERLHVLLVSRRHLRLLPIKGVPELLQRRVPRCALVGRRRRRALDDDLEVVLDGRPEDGVPVLDRDAVRRDAGGGGDVSGRQAPEAVDVLRHLYTFFSRDSIATLALEGVRSPPAAGGRGTIDAGTDAVEIVVVNDVGCVPPSTLAASLIRSLAATPYACIEKLPDVFPHRM